MSLDLSAADPAKTRVADPHHFIADQDPAFHFDSDPDPAIRFQCGSGFLAFHFNADPDPDLFIKVIWICYYWFADPMGLHFGPPRFHCECQWPSTTHFEPVKLLNLKCGSGSIFSL
jgi:hypothetical protein